MYLSVLMLSFCSGVKRIVDLMYLAVLKLIDFLVQNLHYSILTVANYVSLQFTCKFHDLYFLLLALS